MPSRHFSAKDVISPELVKKISNDAAGQLIEWARQIIIDLQ
jgi:hypothetical protein